MPGTHYAMGFAVSPPDGQQVLLLEKNRPAFPAGRIEPGEPLRPSAWHGSMHLLAIGANPNTLTKAKAYRFAIKKEVDRYSAIRRRQNALSLAVFYPTCFQALLEAGAMIDRRVVEAIVYVGNWNHYQRRHDPRHRWDMHNIASSIQAMFNHHASACLYREYLDMSDMKISLPMKSWPLCIRQQNR